MTLGAVTIPKDPNKFVGKAMSFFGTANAFEMKMVDGKMATIAAYDCKARDGTSLRGAMFAFDENTASATPAAGKADSKTLMHVTGIVKDVRTVKVGSSSQMLPFLDSVKMELATEAK